MTRFQSWHDGRRHVHIWPTSQFHTRYLHVKCHHTLQRDGLTATAILPYLWLEGTTRYPDAAALMRRADALYGTVLRSGISKRADQHIAELYALFPDPAHTREPQLAQRVAELALEVLTSPAHEGNAFVPGHVHRQRTLHERRLESVYDDKMAYAFERCAALALEGCPEGLPRLGFTDDLDSVTPEGLWQAQTRLFEDADIHVYWIGPMEAAEREVERWFTGLPQGAVNAETRRQVQPVPVRAGEARSHEETQPIHQGKLNVVLKTGIGMADPTYPALLMATGILGGFPHSKLFINVREKNSLAYYASARLDALTGLIHVQTGIDPRNKDRALEIIEAQIRALQAGEITDDEFEFTRKGLRHQYLQTLDQPLSLADLHFSGQLAGVDKEPEDWIEALDAVTRDEVVAAAAAMRVDTIYFLHGDAMEGGQGHG
ncbi:MAG: insulinase family protein [Thermoflavifilum sp.]|nr:insulinase family protein [Thermoflavifilum sp.]MCL6513625.1 insulinase family protein [Alicyclobacillus sp.]